MKDIAEVIRKKIESSGMKQKAVAEKIGTDPVILSAMLNKRRKIYATDFIKLCLFLGLTIDDFTDKEKEN